MVGTMVRVLVRGLLFLGLLLLITGPAAAHLRAVSPLRGFLIFAGGAGLLFLSIFGLPMMWKPEHRPPGRMVGLLAVGFLGPVAGLIWAGSGHPRINDISTDPDHPLPFVKLPGALARDGWLLAPPPPRFVELQKAGYPGLGPLSLDQPPERAVLLVVEEAKRRPGWTLMGVDEATGTVEGIAESWLFRFPDAFVIQVTAKPGGSLVHMRSCSRYGKGDLGANSKRITEFLGAVSAGSLAERSKASTRSSPFP